MNRWTDDPMTRFSRPLLIHARRLTIVFWTRRDIHDMPATGELIRMMNYVDDLAATLRRIHAGITGMTAEERKRLADYMRNMEPSFPKTLETLDKA